MGLSGLKCAKMGTWVKACLEGPKHLCVVGTPGEGGVLESEANKGDDDVGKPNNELAIEVGEA